MNPMRNFINTICFDVIGRIFGCSYNVQRPTRRIRNRHSLSLGVESLEVRLLLTNVFSPTAHWSFDSISAPSVIVDDSGNGHDLTLVNAPPDAGRTGSATTDSENQFALKVQGNTTYARVENLADTTVESLLFWVKSDRSLTTDTSPSVLIDFKENGLHDTISFGRWTPSLDNEGLTIVDSLEEGGFRATSVTGVDLAAEQWMHVGLVWNDQNQYYDVYLDGQLQSVVSNSRGHARKIELDAILLGRRDYTTSPLGFDGSFDELKIFSHALTKEQIAEFASNKRVSPVAYWSFEDISDSSVIVDDSGNGHDLTLVNAPPDAGRTGSATTDSENQFALKVQGNTTYARVENLADTTVESLLFWVKSDRSLTTDTSPSVLIDFKENGLHDTISFGRWTPSLDNEGLTIVDSLEEGGFRATSVTGVDLAAEQWMHVGLVWNDQNQYYDVYLDGQLQSVVSNSRGHARKIELDAILLGRRDYTTSPLGFDGSFDELKIFSHALTKEQIAEFASNKRVSPVAHWNFDGELNPDVVLDESSHGFELVLHNLDPITGWEEPATTRPTDQFSLRLQGDLSYATLDSLETTPVESLAFWVKSFRDVSPSTTTRTLLDLKEEGTQNTVHFGSLSSSLTNEGLTLVDSLDSGGFRATAVPDFRLEAGQWVHIAFVWDASLERYEIFVNGEVQTVVPNTRGHARRISAEALVLGRNGDSNNPRGFAGAFDDIRIYKDSLSATQVRELASQPNMVATNTPPVSGHPLEFTTTSNTQYGIRLDGFDADGDAISYVIETMPEHGRLLVSDSTQFVTYVADADYVGVDSFEYRPFDGTQYGDRMIISVQVEPTTNPSLSYFVPGAGTLNTELGTPELPTLTGTELPFDMIVNSQFGKLIERIDQQGQVVWRYQQPFANRAVDVYENQVVFAAQREIHVLDVESGILIRTYSLGADTADLAFVNQLDDDHLLVSRKIFGESTYRVELWSLTSGLQWTNPFATSYPRWADSHGNLIAVTDTFGHRVYVVNRLTNELVAEQKVFFPNDVRFLNDTTLLITEEHADRVWKYDFVTNSRTLVLSAPDSRADLTLSHEQVLLLSNDPALRIDPENSRSKSKSSVEYSGNLTLYAPNGAIQLPDGSYYIADTDNHRVIHVSAESQILAVVGLFNNPTKVAFLNT